MEVPRRNPGRCGERGRQEAVERLQRLLWLGREQWPWWPWRPQAGPWSCEQRSARWLLSDPSLEAGYDLHGTDQALHFGVSLFFEDLLDPTSGCYDVFHHLVS